MFLVAGPGGVETFGSSRGAVATSEVCIIRHIRNVRAECLGGLDCAAFLVLYGRTYVHTVTVSYPHSYTHPVILHMCTGMHRRYTNMHTEHAYTETCTGTERAWTGTTPAMHRRAHSEALPPCIAAHCSAAVASITILTQAPSSSCQVHGSHGSFCRRRALPSLPPCHRNRYY